MRKHSRETKRCVDDSNTVLKTERGIQKGQKQNRYSLYETQFDIFKISNHDRVGGVTHYK